MTKYLLLWEIDTTRTPDDPEARKQQWRTLQDMVVKQLEDGDLKDWGMCLGEMNGYCIIEGTAADVAKFTLVYSPYVIFEVREVRSIQQAIVSNSIFVSFVLLCPFSSFAINLLFAAPLKYGSSIDGTD